MHDALHLTVTLPVVRAAGRTAGRQRVALAVALAVVGAQVACRASGIGHPAAAALLALCAFQAYAIWCLLRQVVKDEVATTDERFSAASMCVPSGISFACRPRAPAGGRAPGAGSARGAPEEALQRD